MQPGWGWGMARIRATPLLRAQDSAIGLRLSRRRFLTRAEVDDAVGMDPKREFEQEEEKVDCLHQRPLSSPEVVYLQVTEFNLGPGERREGPRKVGCLLMPSGNGPQEWVTKERHGQATRTRTWPRVSPRAYRYSQTRVHRGTLRPKITEVHADPRAQRHTQTRVHKGMRRHPCMHTNAFRHTHFGNTHATSQQ